MSGRKVGRAVLTATALLLALLTSREGHAQAAAESLLKDAPGDDHVRGRVAMDPAFMFGLGYVRGIDVGPSGSRKLGVHVELDTLLDGSSWKLTSGVSARLLDRPGFDVRGSLDLDLDLAQNEVHTALAYGYRVALFPGYYRRTWYAAAELGFRGNLASTLWHKAGYLEQTPGAIDGTYVTGTAFLNFGVAAGLRCFRHYFVGVRAAYRVPTTFESYGPWVQPMLVGLELGGTIRLF